MFLISTKYCSNERIMCYIIIFLLQKQVSHQEFKGKGNTPEVACVKTSPRATSK